jgi:hypothetical protein
MIPQVTNRKIGGLTPCHSHRVSLFHLKIAKHGEQGSESAWCIDYREGELPGQGVGGGGGKNRQISPKPPKMYKNAPIAGGFTHVLPFFPQNCLIRYTKKCMDEFLIFLLIKAMWSDTCSKFRELYTPPATRISDNT